MLPGFYRSSLHLLLGLATSVISFPVTDRQQSTLSSLASRKDARVLILGGGVSGVTAARTLYDNDISDFIILEARHELGGRMMNRLFGAPGKTHMVEVGANWVQGTRSGDGPENPIWTLAKKHNLTTRHSSFYDSISMFDETGPVDFQDTFKAAIGNYARLASSAGERVSQSLVDANARSGYSLTGSFPTNYHEMAAEYYQFDWEFSQSPEQTSWIASSWAVNSTFRPESGGFSEVNAMSVDQRGFKTLVQSEAASFDQSRIRLNSTVKTIEYSPSGVQVTLASGETLSADHAICTFSLGVLQHDDIVFKPQLPHWKREAIHSMTMGVFTKIFLQFPHKFWFETEMALYADRERGRYAVWQSLDHPSYLPGSGLIFVTVTGDFSRRVESLPVGKVKSEVLSVLRSMFPNTTVPKPLDFYFHSWLGDPLFRGSYSNWPASFLIEHSVNLKANVDEKLWFAGEATSQRYFGYLHGAYFEGRDIALLVAQCINQGECVKLEHIKNVRTSRPYETP